MLGRWPLLLIVGLSLLAAQDSVALASHPFQGSGQYGDINYLYRSLEVPTGIGTITYSLCGTTEHPSTPAQWATGVENWDSAIARWQFNQVSCGTGANTKVTWEAGADLCGGIAWACWNRGGNTSGHGSHLDLGFSQLDPTRIIVNFNNWNSRPNDQWRVYIAAHEWGHNMSLADHASSTCAENTLMLNYTAGTLPANPCNQSPTSADLNSVACNVYKLCAGVRVAAGDVIGGNGCDEVITAPGPGLDPWVRVWVPLVGCDWTSGVVPVAQFLAYVEGFEGGVYVAAGNIDTSTVTDEIITGAGPGGGPHVRVWRVSGTSVVEVTGFMAYESNFTGGVRVGAGDLDCDGADEVLTAPGPVRDVQILSVNLDLSQVYSGGFDAYGAFNSGGFVAGGNMNTGPCGDEILTGADAGGGPHVRSWCCASGGEMTGFFPYSSGFTGGARVAVGNNDSSTTAHEMITAPGPGSGPGPYVRVWRCCASPPTEVMSFYAYATGWAGGVFVASGNVDGSGNWEIITGADAGGGPHVRIWRCCTSPPPELTGWMAWSP